MIGQSIGHYRLEDKLGRGGFGTVYRGVHAHLPSLHVAVKVVHDNLAADSGFQRLLEKEVEVLHGLQHPGIVAFRDLVVEPTGIAIVLELLEGLDLRHALQQGAFSPDEVARVLWELLDALAYAHRRGVVHRDIKPDNMFLCSDGRIKLMDFGIAKVAHSTLATQSGMVSGTLDYMAPERFRHESPPSSDLYSLGLVCWELLTGRVACPLGDIPSKIGWHMGRGAPDVRGELPSCPAWLAGFLNRLAAVEVEDRPRDADAALQELTENWPVPGPQRSTPVRPRGCTAAEPEAPSISGSRRGPSSPTLAPGLTGFDGDLPLVQKSTPTWSPFGEPPPPEPLPSRPPIPCESYPSRPGAGPPPPEPPTFADQIVPRGAALLLAVVAWLSGLGGSVLALAVASSDPPESQIGTGLGVVAIGAMPAASFFFFLAAMVDRRALSRALWFGLSTLAILGTATFMPIAMLADKEALATAVTGGVCCGGLPSLLPGALALVFLVRGLRQLRAGRTDAGSL